jgi:hypothetical protein
MEIDIFFFLLQRGLKPEIDILKEQNLYAVTVPLTKMYFFYNKKTLFKNYWS